MVRIALHTEDRTLLPLLSSALGKDFQIVLAADEVEINRLVCSAACDVIMLDFKCQTGARTGAVRSFPTHSRAPSPLHCDG